MTSLTRRLLTATIAIPAALSVVFFAPGDLAFLVFFAIIFLAAIEMMPMARAVAPTAPFGLLWVLIPLAAAMGFGAVRNGSGEVSIWTLLAALSAVVTVTACAMLLSGTDVRDGMAACGIMAFAIPYFALPPIFLYWLQDLDPWLLVALLGIVWMGDTGAFVVGNLIGRRKLAPELSPGKTWEGAVGGFAGSLLATAVWSLLRLGELHLGLMALAVVTAVVSQLGDLVESVFKRGAGVKDSSNLLPGHGGLFDRMDSTLLATPIFVVGVQWLGVGGLMPA